MRIGLIRRLIGLIGTCVSGRWSGNCVLVGGSSRQMNSRSIKNVWRMLIGSDLFVVSVGRNELCIVIQAHNQNSPEYIVITPCFIFT